MIGYDGVLIKPLRSFFGLRNKVEIVVALMALAVVTVRSDEIGGVGIAVRVEEGKVFVAKILPDTPAARTRKLQTNDCILAIRQSDGESISVDGKSIIEVVSLLRGRIGSTVCLTIISAGKSQAEAYVLRLERASLNLPLLASLALAQFLRSRLFRLAAQHPPEHHWPNCPLYLFLHRETDQLGVLVPHQKMSVV